MPGTFKSYMKNITAKTGMSRDDFWRQAKEKGFVRGGKIVAKHSELLAWLKSDVGLGHVHANFIIMYLRLRADNPNVSAGMKRWAISTGY